VASFGTNYVKTMGSGIKLFSRVVNPLKTEFLLSNI
jgi:hypothetical protein